MWQEAELQRTVRHAEGNKGANHDNVLSKLYKSTNDVEISVTYFGGGPIERFQVDGDSVPTDWRTGQPNTRANFIACSVIQVVYGGVNLTTPTACAQTTFSASRIFWSWNVREQRRYFAPYAIEGNRVARTSPRCALRPQAI